MDHEDYPEALFMWAMEYGTRPPIYKPRLAALMAEPTLFVEPEEAE